MDGQLGIRIRKLRLNAGLTQMELANMLNVSTALISAYELGERKPSLGVLVNLASSFKVSTDYLLGMGGTIPGRLEGLSQQETLVVEALIELFHVKENV